MRTVYDEPRLSKRTLSSWLVDIIKHRAVEILAVMRRKLASLSRPAGLHSEKLFDSDLVRVRCVRSVRAYFTIARGETSAKKGQVYRLRRMMPQSQV